MIDKRAITLLAAAMLSAHVLAQSASPVAAVWAVNDGEKVARDDLANPNKGGNSAWDGMHIRLFGARNEVLAFQVIVESGANGIQQLSLSLPALTSTSSQSSIDYQAPVDDPSQYVGRPIQLFSENYMYIPGPSSATWIYVAGSPSAPTDIVGWKPVQLVPENALVGRGGFPLTVAPLQNQGFWIEIYTGKDLPAGMYEGTVQVSADGAVIGVPVELELFDFTLPDQNSINAMFYYESSQPELYQGLNLDDAYHRFAHRNRVEFVNAYDQAAALAAQGRFDGSTFTAATGYEGPGEATGNIILPATFYGPGTAFDTQASARSTSDEWMTFLAAFLPQAITFVYLPDEPSASQYPYILSISSNIKSDPGIGKNLPLFVTTQWVQQLDGAGDVRGVEFLLPPAHDGVGGGEHQVDDLLGRRDLLGHRGAGQPDPGAQIEDVDLAHLLTEDLHRALRGECHRRGDLEQGSLARPVGTDEDPALVAVRRPVHVAQQDRRVTPDLDATQPQYLVGH